MAEDRAEDGGPERRHGRQRVVRRQRVRDTPGADSSVLNWLTAGRVATCEARPSGGLGPEPGLDLGGVWMMEAAEDGQRLLPGVAGRLMVSRGVLAIAEFGEGVGLMVAVTELAIQGQGLLVAGDRVWVAAEAVQRGAGAGPRRGLPMAGAPGPASGPRLRA